MDVAPGQEPGEAAGARAAALSAPRARHRPAVASDPVHEEAQGLLMRLLVQAGRRHLALRQYQALRAALQRELEVEPEARLQALYQDIQGSRFSEPSPHQGSEPVRVDRTVEE